MGLSGNITINGGMIYANGGYHGNAFGDGCWAKEHAGSSELPSYKILVTGGTLLAKRGAGKGNDLGGLNTDVVVLGGSMKAESFNSKGKSYAYGSESLDENFKVFMTRIRIVGASCGLVNDLDMKIAGVAYPYGKPSYTDEEGYLYLWLPSENAENKEISVDLEIYEVETGNKIETESFFITNAGSGDFLKQYITFEVEKDRLPIDSIKKVYDGKGLNGETIKNQIADLEIETYLPANGKLNQSSSMSIQAQRLKDDGVTVEDDAEIFDFDEDEAIPGGKYQLIITSTQFSNSSEGGFKDAFWGHRAYFKYAEVLPADTITTISFEKSSGTDYVRPNEDLVLEATVVPNPCEEDGTSIDNTSCAAPTGKVQFYINGEKYGEPVELVAKNKDTTGEIYNYSVGTIEWKKEEQARYQKDEEITVSVEYLGEDINYEAGSQDSDTFKVTNPNPVLTGSTAYTLTFKGVPNVEYEIHDEEGMLIATVRTDENGKGIASDLEMDSYYTISNAEFGSTSGKTLPIDAKDLADMFRESGDDEATQTGKEPGIDEKAENSKVNIGIDEDGNYKIVLKDDIEDTTVIMPDCGGKITIDLNDHDITGPDATEQTPAGPGLLIKKEDGITSTPGTKLDITDSTGNGKIEGGKGSEEYPDGANGISAGSGTEKPEDVEITIGENADIIGGDGAPGANGTGGLGGQGIHDFFDVEGKEENVTDGTQGAPWRNPVPSLQKTAENKTHAGDKTTVEDRITYTIKVENLKEGSLWKEVAIRDRLPQGLELDTDSMYLTKPNGETLHIEASAYKEAERMISIYVGDVYGGEKCVFSFDVIILKEAIGKDIGNEAIAIGGNSAGTDGPGSSDGNGGSGDSDGTGGWGSGDQGWSDGYTEGEYVPGSPYFPEDDPFNNTEDDHVAETDAPVYPWEDDILPEGVLPGNAEPEISKTVENETHPEGDTQQEDILIYRINLTNPKEGTLWKNVMIFDYLPEELTLDTDSLELTYPDGTTRKISASVYDETTHMISIPIDELWGGETYTLTYKAKVTVEENTLDKEEIVNRVEVTGENPDGSKTDIGEGPSASVPVKYPEIKTEDPSTDKDDDKEDGLPSDKVDDKEDNTPGDKVEDKEDEIPGGQEEDKEDKIPGGQEEDKEDEIPGGREEDKENEIPGDQKEDKVPSDKLEDKKDEVSGDKAEDETQQGVDTGDYAPVTMLLVISAISLFAIVMVLRKRIKM